MAKRTIKINIKLPAGVSASDELIDKATKAANNVVVEAVSEIIEAQNIAKELAKKGIEISAEEVLSRKSRTKAVHRKTTTSKAPKATGTRKRVVLSNAKRKSLIADLKAGAKIAEAAEKYGVSTATVMKIKTSAKLTKTRK